jgi:hypothetical protein
MQEIFLIILNAYNIKSQIKKGSFGAGMRDIFAQQKSRRTICVVMAKNIIVVTRK